MAVAITALVAGLGGVAVASPIGGDGKVHLCYSQAGVDVNDGNQVVAVNAGSPCPPEYPQSLVLNQTGPQGPTGVPGASGPQGTPGGTKPLDKEKTKQAVKQLEKVDEVADKTKDKLEALAAKLRAAKGKSIDEDLIRLMQHQQRMAEILRQITEAMNQIADTNRKVIRDLD
jgi:hypothetical protein